MNRHNAIFNAALAAVAVVLAGCAGSARQEEVEGFVAADAQTLRRSLVFLDVTAYDHEQLQPWKSPDLVERSGYGVAVGPYSVLTTAWNVGDAAFIKARLADKNEFITAAVKVVDYESNLCLLELDEGSTGEPLTPVVFADDFQRGADLDAYWLESDGRVATGRGTLDRAEVRLSTVSWARMINYIVTNAGRVGGSGRLFVLDGRPVGIACWLNTDTGETGLIPAETIEKFLDDAADGAYAGFAAEGFEATELADPAMRAHLKLGSDVTDGIYVNKVHKLGTGSDALRAGDVILGIDDTPINARGQYRHERHDSLSYHHLITRHTAGDEIAFDVWRGGERIRLDVKAVGVRASDMLIPFHQFDHPPRYLVTAGYVLQQLSRDYLEIWGEDWSGKVPPHLYNYYRNSMFDPSAERREIVIVSYVLPHQINLGYHTIGRAVVSKCDGRPVSCLEDVAAALRADSDSPFHTLELEQDNPVIVIPRDALAQADAQIAKLYGIAKPTSLPAVP